MINKDVGKGREMEGKEEEAAHVREGMGAASVKEEGRGEGSRKTGHPFSDFQYLLVCRYIFTCRTSSPSPISF